jgi:hypothetical protein
MHILGNLRISGYDRYASKQSVSYKDIDIKNVQFLNYNFEYVIVNNLHMDLTSFDGINQLNDYNNNIAYNMNKHLLVLSFCKLGENINILKANEVYLRNILNLNDYSFIKHIDSKLTINFDNKNGLPKCNNLKGIPTSGNYALKVSYRADNDIEEYDDMEMQTLENIPNNVKSIDYNVAVRPWYFFHNFSFKGLTKELLPKFEFTAYYFKGKDIPVPVRLGPFELNVRAKKWHPTKPQYETIIATQDWFLDCWLTEPHKTYTEPEINDTVDAKQLKKAEKYKQKVNDEQEDRQKMTKLLITVLNTYNKFYTTYNILTIKQITDTYIKYSIKGRYTDRIFNDTFDKFLTYYILSKTAPNLYI